jgi:23S rRNA (pseudouridine1915-N3)-methyltransferase
VRYRLICVDRVRESYVAAAVDDFTRRLSRRHAIEIVEVAAQRGSDARRARLGEGEAVLRQIAPGDVVWLLERTGTLMTSVELAERLRTLALEGVGQLVLVVAGTYGASDALLARANLRWSLSPLTFLHEWTRAIVLEQLYRAGKIAGNEPYHH